MENLFNYLLSLFSLDSIKHSNKEKATIIVKKIKEDYRLKAKKLGEYKSYIEMIKLLNESLNKDIKSNEQNIKSKDQNIELLKNENLSLKNEILSLKNNLESFQKEKEFFQKEKESFQKEIESLKNELKINNIYFQYKSADLSDLKKNTYIQYNNCIFNNSEYNENYFNINSTYSNKKRRLN